MKLAMDELIKHGWELMEMQRSMMSEKGNIPMSFLVFGDDGQTDMIIAPEAEVINDGRAKSALMKSVRQRCAEMKACAVFSISDSFMGEYRSRSGRELDAEMLRLIAQIGSAEAERLGVIPKRREAIIVQVNTPLATTLLVQFYRRESSGRKECIVWEETQERKGDPLPEGINVRTRLSGYFDYMQTGGAV